MESSLSPIVRDLGRLYLEQIGFLSEKITKIEKRLRHEAGLAETTARLQTMPGIGPITAMAIEAFAPPLEAFKRGRDFAAWLGLVPTQHSTGGKQRLGRLSKMGQRDIRRLLITGAMSVVQWASRRGGMCEGSWLARMLARKPRMLVATALANSERISAIGPSACANARSVWAMLTKAGKLQRSGSDRSMIAGASGM